ncbi:hypothetical protein [Pseudodesulfovibrio sediminis]|uniref:Uncharacterized protein n=1 Tax=Pseudodesulfovibrio sediminis TaxID=2810563 RepID=A0ABN6EUY5_9BACT|nr:hypothetical protein [Pseudodesulfovibrio sediminis]BCS90106.1 hypothetical protein PSDVSF_33480 [Pseudodesulfovibrio sediminis]
MRRILFAIVLTMTFMTGSALASEYEDMDRCLGRAVVARLVCKDVDDVQFVSKVRDNLYLFSVFYARQEARFIVGVSSKSIRVQGREFLKLTKTIPYNFDDNSKCGVATFSSPECPTSAPIVCCSEKTVEDKLDDKFWGRPIPDLLDEDLKKALEMYKEEQEANPDGKPAEGTEAAPQQ